MTRKDLQKVTYAFKKFFDDVMSRQLEISTHQEENSRITVLGDL